MFANIIISFIARFSSALLSFVIVIITSHLYGSIGRGVISMIILCFAINNLVNNFVGGSALVYLVPRNTLSKLLFPSYWWAVISTVLVNTVLYFLNMLPPYMEVHIFILSFLQSIGSIHLFVLMGKERVNVYNMVTTFQVVLMVIVLTLVWKFIPSAGMEWFLCAQYISFSFILIFSGVIVWPYLQLKHKTEGGGVLKKLAGNSTLIQLASMTQLLNYRLGYIQLDSLNLKKQLGVFSNATSIAESVWLISKSMVMVQYPRVANSMDIDRSRKLTLVLSRLSLWMTVIVSVILVFIPDSFYTFLFGKDFIGVSQLMYWFFPGIVMISLSNLFTHYYAGIGKNSINAWASFLGFLTTISTVYILINKMGMQGAALSASLSYTTSAVFLIICFLKETGFSVFDILPQKEDFSLILKELKADVNKIE